MCSTHYNRWRATCDDAEVKTPTRGIPWQWVDRGGPNGCWLWTGAVTHNGYGQVSRDGRHHMAYRYFYQLLVEAIAPGLELDHLCRNPACVNPEHMEPVTHAENMRRARAHKETGARRTA